MFSTDETTLIQDALEDELAPVTLNLAVATESACEAGRLVTDLLTTQDELFNGIFEAKAFARLFLIGLVDLLAEGLQVFAQGLEGLFCPLVEVYGTLLQDVAGDGTEAVAEFFGELALLRLELFELFGEGSTLGLHYGQTHIRLISLLL